MKNNATNDFTAIILVTLVFGIFVFSGTSRIIKAAKGLRMVEDKKENRFKNTLDIIFSSIFVLASIAFYLIFLFIA